MKILATAVLVVVLVLGQWAWFAAPCGLYSFARADEIPGRCVMNR
ncbi:hypothetical protein ACFYW9_19445 [Streptomyces sp. NPDC002698]